MSKKFRTLVGAMLSTSICSCCVSSGVSEVGILAKKIKELIGEDNYNVLKAFYELEKENLENSDSPVGSKLASEGLILKVDAYDYDNSKHCKDVNEVVSWFKEGKSYLLSEVVGHLEFLFKSIFVTGNAEEVIRGGSRESEFCFGGYGGFKVWFTDNSVFISCRHASYNEFFCSLELSKTE